MTRQTDTEACDTHCSCKSEGGTCTCGGPSGCKCGLGCTCQTKAGRGILQANRG